MLYKNVVILPFVIFDFIAILKNIRTIGTHLKSKLFNLESDLQHLPFPTFTIHFKVNEQAQKIGEPQGIL